MRTGGSNGEPHMNEDGYITTKVEIPEPRPVDYWWNLIVWGDPEGPPADYWIKARERALKELETKNNQHESTR